MWTFCLGFFRSFAFLRGARKVFQVEFLRAFLDEITKQRRPFLSTKINIKAYFFEEGKLQDKKEIAIVYVS